ncbi:MAG: hypothetical protein GY700_12650 [Propionibacteriaceae bacterium]|nr:hypothetical protein [Propionibacteriaceae bacterium]
MRRTDEKTQNPLLIAFQNPTKDINQCGVDGTDFDTIIPATLKNPYR